MTSTLEYLGWWRFRHAQALKQPYFIPYHLWPVGIPQRGSYRGRPYPIYRQAAS